MSDTPLADTTRPSSEFLSAVAEKLAARRRQRGDAVTAQAEQPLAEDTVTSMLAAYVRAAAVLAWFEPAAFRPLGSAADPALLERLLSHCVQTADGEGGRRWTLEPSRRIAALRELRGAGLIENALAANVRPTDPVQQALEAYLLGNAKPIESQTQGELAATYQVCEWLRPAGFDDLPQSEAIARRTDWLRLLQPFEHLAGDDQFRGRSRELQQLRSYVGVMPPGSLVESVGRTIQQIFRLYEKPPLLITGPGGVGKSTLLARFILEHARALEDERFPFVYLDIDRAEVDAGEPLTLLIEAARQIGVEYPFVRDSCETLRHVWVDAMVKSRQQIASQSASVKSSESAASTLAAAIHDFSSVVLSLGASGLPVVLVLDTFEEVQWQSASHVAAVWALLEDMQTLLPRLRVIVAGRADVEGHSTEALPLTGLDEEAAVGYLRARGFADETVARRVARQIGGSPLSLKLAVELAKQEGLDKQGRLPVTTREFFFLRLDSALVQRQLFKRVLTHVHDKSVRKLAYPGLILRRITPDVILNVLAEPCGIEIRTPAEADGLFADLRREVALVSVAPDGSLRHRQDLRIVMVELLRAEDPDKVNTIHERAVAYYEKRSPTATERAEEIYHRLQLDQDREALDARWIEGVDRHLASAIEEFSGRRRAYLASRLGADVDEATRNLADLEDWEKITGRRAEALLMQDAPERALELIQSRSERSSASPLVGLEGRALARLSRFDEAMSVLNSGFDRAVTEGARAASIAIALQAAEVVISLRSKEQAAPAFDRLARVCDDAASPIQQLEGAIRGLGLIKLDEALAAREPDLRRKFETLFDQLRDDKLMEEAGLGYWAATQFQQADARRLARVIALAGLPRSADTEMRQLAGELTAFDVAFSRQAGAPPGLLAAERGISIPTGGSLTGAWSDYLIQSPDAVVRDGLAKLLNEHAEQVPARVMESFANLMLVTLGVRLSGSSEPSRPLTSTTGNAPHAGGPLLRRVAEALLNAFSFDELAPLVRLSLNRNLEAITPANAPLSSKLFDLVRVANAEGWLADLVAQAYYEKPGNPELAAVATEFGITGFATASMLEHVVRGPSSINVAAFVSTLDQVSAGVCRVEIGGIFFGTGFLIGADLLLTAEFLLSHVLAGSVSPAEVAFRFDYHRTRYGAGATSGTVFRLGRDWLVAYEPMDSLSEGLGYVLVRVAGSPGAQPIGGGRGASRRLRQWLTLRPDPVEQQPGDSLFIFGHNEGQPTALSEGAFLGISANGTRMRYDNNTSPGSSGAPCLNASLQLVGMHLGLESNFAPSLDERRKFGVPAAAIVHDLERKGLGGAAQTVFA